MPSERIGCETKGRSCWWTGFEHLLLALTELGAQIKLAGTLYEVAHDRREHAAHHLQRFLLSALAASIGGILPTSLNKLGAEYISEGYDFTAVTAVVPGGGTLACSR